jgi:hypothetical protein
MLQITIFKKRHAIRMITRAPHPLIYKKMLSHADTLRRTRQNELSLESSTVSTCFVVKARKSQPTNQPNKQLEVEEYNTRPACQPEETTDMMGCTENRTTHFVQIQFSFSVQQKIL